MTFSLGNDDRLGRIDEGSQALDGQVGLVAVRFELDADLDHSPPTHLILLQQPSSVEMERCLAQLLTGLSHPLGELGELAH